MIYVFDDRRLRREENENKLRDFSNLIEFKTIQLSPDKTTEECIIDSIDKNSECIIFHKSYAFNEPSTTFEEVRQLFIGLGETVVIFSGGTEGSGKSKDEKEINMNADLMYKNLPYFLEDFKTNGHINIDTLLWGKRYELNALLQFQNKIAEDLFVNNDLDDKVDVDDIKERIEYELSSVNDELAKAIISDLDKCEQISHKDLMVVIDNNIQKFV